VHGLFSSHGWIIQLLPRTIYRALNINLSLTTVNIRLNNKSLENQQKTLTETPKKPYKAPQSGIIYLNKTQTEG
jgi:hypothetical protein